jgi:hypothetical protein
VSEKLMAMETVMEKESQRHVTERAEEAEMQPLRQSAFFSFS